MIITEIADNHGNKLTFSPGLVLLEDERFSVVYVNSRMTGVKILRNEPRKRQIFFIRWIKELFSRGL